MWNVKANGSEEEGEGKTTLWLLRGLGRSAPRGGTGRWHDKIQADVPRLQPEIQENWFNVHGLSLARCNVNLKPEGNWGPDTVVICQIWQHKLGLHKAGAFKPFALRIKQSPQKVFQYSYRSRWGLDSTFRQGRDYETKPFLPSKPNNVFHQPPGDLVGTFKASTMVNVLTLQNETENMQRVLCV